MNSGILGTGVYSVSEARRLTGIPQASIRRWLWGQSGRYVAAPLWQPELPRIDGQKALGFRDLIEIQFVQKFRERNVSLQTIRRALAKAKELFRQDYPLSTLKFKTRSGQIFAEIECESSSGRGAFELISGQYILDPFIDHLYSVLEFTDLDRVARWWPLGRDRKVVLDPERNMGHPIVSNEGVPAQALADAYSTEGSIEAVAEWYEVSAASVKDSVEFISGLAA